MNDLTRPNPSFHVEVIPHCLPLTMNGSCKVRKSRESNT